MSDTEIDLEPNTEYRDRNIVSAGFRDAIITAIYADYNDVGYRRGLRAMLVLWSIAMTPMVVAVVAVFVFIGPDVVATSASEATAKTFEPLEFVKLSVETAFLTLVYGSFALFCIVVYKSVRGGIEK